MSILSYISRGLEFSSINHTLIYKNFESSVLNVSDFKKKYVVIDLTIY